jgi:uncharacterized protein YsxB (DUF464 family)
MTNVKFLADSEKLYGFSVSGHSSRDCDDEVGKIVCAAVSSACYMAANTIIEIVGDECEAEVNDAKMLFKVKNPSDKTVVVLEGLKLHLSELSNQYGNNIRLHGGAKDVKD